MSKVLMLGDKVVDELYRRNKKEYGRNLLPTDYNLYTADGGRYGFYKFLEEPEQVIVTVADNDTSVDMSSIFFGLTTVGADFVGGTWLMSSGTLIHRERSSDYQHYFSYYPNNEGTLNKIFQRYNIKIEHGNKATEWSAAPEDVVDLLKPQTYPLATT